MNESDNLIEYIQTIISLAILRRKLKILYTKYFSIHIHIYNIYTYIYVIHNK